MRGFVCTPKYENGVVEEWVQAGSHWRVDPGRSQLGTVLCFSRLRPGQSIDRIAYPMHEKDILTYYLFTREDWIKTRTKDEIRWEKPDDARRSTKTSKNARKKKARRQRRKEEKDAEPRNRVEAFHCKVLDNPGPQQVCTAPPHPCSRPGH